MLLCYLQVRNMDRDYMLSGLLPTSSLHTLTQQMLLGDYSSGLRAGQASVKASVCVESTA